MRRAPPRTPHCLARLLRVDSQPWTDLDRWAAYLDTTTDDPSPDQLDPAAGFALGKELEIKHRLGHLALAVAGEEPSLSWTVAAAVRVYWQETAVRRRPVRRPVWWTVPTRLPRDQVPRALAEHLGAPVARGHDPVSLVRDSLVEQAVPVLVLSGLGNVPVGRTARTSLPRVLALLVKTTGTLLVFAEPQPGRVLFNVPGGDELATRTSLIELPRPELASPAVP